MSIFRKICPACSSSVSSDRARCLCGHDFNGAEDSHRDAICQALAESELMEAYLVARVEQAVSVVDAARATLTHGAGDYVAAAQILRAVIEARALRDELAAQRENSESLRQQLGTKDAPRAGSAFTAAQDAKARQIVARFEGTETKNCPKCGITLPLASALCLCGHAFGTTSAATTLPRTSRHAIGTAPRHTTPRS